MVMNYVDSSEGVLARSGPHYRVSGVLPSSCGDGEGEGGGGGEGEGEQALYEDIKAYV